MPVQLFLSILFVQFELFEALHHIFVLSTSHLFNEIKKFILCIIIVVKADIWVNERHTT